MIARLSVKVGTLISISSSSSSSVDVLALVLSAAVFVLTSFFSSSSGN
jgi:hypothetical protein